MRALVLVLISSIAGVISFSPAASAFDCAGFPLEEGATTKGVKPGDTYYYGHETSDSHYLTFQWTGGGVGSVIYFTVKRADSQEHCMSTECFDVLEFGEFISTCDGVSGNPFLFIKIEYYGPVSAAWTINVAH